MGVIEVVKILTVDILILSIFCLAAYIGYQRSYRLSLINLIIQLVTIILSGLISRGLVYKVVAYIPKRITLSSLIPDNFYYLVEPYETSLIPFILFCILFVSFFVVIKSILYVFSVDYEWYRYVFPSAKFNRLGDRLFSMFLSILNMYTYMIIVLIMIAFPLFNLVKPYSVSNLLLKVNPYISHMVADLYEPYEGLQESIVYFGEDIESIFHHNKVDLSQLEDFIEKNPNERKKIHSAFEEFIPFIATTSGFLSFFPDNQISEKEMKDYLTKMQAYIEKDVMTLEIFNSYYKELIQNGTCGRLIEDEVISDKALKTLINSDMLNDVNLKKIKEYKTLD